MPRNSYLSAYANRDPMYSVRDHGLPHGALGVVVARMGSDGCQYGGPGLSEELPGRGGPVEFAKIRFVSGLEREIEGWYHVNDLYRKAPYEIGEG